MTHSGYLRQAAVGYLKKSMPPIDSNTPSLINEQIQERGSSESGESSRGLDGALYRGPIWTAKAFQEFSPSRRAVVLQTQLGTRSAPWRQLPSNRLLRPLQGGQQQLLDVAGDGQPDLVDYSGPTPGFFERTEDKNWHESTPFASLPEHSLA